MIPAQAQWSDESGTFKAYWTFSGSIYIMEFGDDRKVATGRLQGPVVIETSQGPIPSFDTDGIFFSDEGKIGIGRCIWKGISGDEIYVELESNGPVGFGKARGKFIGGTGRFEGITGRFTFEWSYFVSGGNDATLDGHTVTMTGNYKLQSR
jgi:hypothetical protein